MTGFFSDMSPLWPVGTPKSSNTEYPLQSPLILQSFMNYGFPGLISPCVCRAYYLAKDWKRPLSRCLGFLLYTVPCFLIPYSPNYGHLSKPEPHLFFFLLGETSGLCLDSSSLCWNLKNVPRQNARVNAKLTYVIGKMQAYKDLFFKDQTPVLSVIKVWFWFCTYVHNCL